MMNRKIQGLTLIELLLGMVFGLIVLSGVIFIYISVVSSSSQTLKESKLNSQLMTIMSVMTNDIRRAGYWSTFTETPSSNPFNQLNISALTVFDSMSSNSVIDENTDQDGTCVVFAYDREQDGNLDATTEYFGFRLNDNKIQMRTAGSTANGANCNVDNGTWETISDIDLYSIDTLSFNPAKSECMNTREPDLIDNDSINGVDDNGEIDCYADTHDVGSGDTTVETRELLITLRGTLISDSEVSVTIVQSVKVRNDLVRVR